MAIPEARSKFYRHVHSLRRLLEEDLASKSVSRLILAITVAWQDASYPLLRKGVRRPSGTSRYALRPEVLQFAQWLAECKDFNVAAYWLASAYAILVGDSVRSKASLYFTPPKLAQRVIDGLVQSGASLTEHVWHDPACGGAAFLVPVAQRMALALTQKGKTPIAILQHVAAHLSGTDLEATLLELSKHFLRMALYDLIKVCEYLPNFELKLGDGLLIDPKNAPDIVICNPPYRKLKTSESIIYSEKFSEIIQGQPNIYGLFIHRSIKLAAANGLAGLLTPTSFLSGQYFSKLRSWLLKNGHPHRLEMLSDRKSTFIDVEQETAIMIAGRQSCTMDKEARVNLVVRTTEGVFEEIGDCVLPACGRPWPIAKRIEDVSLVAAGAKSKFRLSNYGFKAKIGHLVDYRDNRKRFPTYSKPSQGRLVFPLIWATDITPEGQFQHGRNRRGNRNELFVELSSKAQGGLITTPVLLLQRVTSTDQPRRLVCTVVPTDWLQEYGGLVAENHVIVVEPINGLETTVSLQTLALILRSEIVDRLFRSISGAANVSIFELDEIPLPDPAIVKRELTVGNDIEHAVLKGYGLMDLTATAA